MTTSYDLIIVCVKDSIKDRHFITLWRPNNSGYTAVIARAGRYTLEQVSAQLDYYNCGGNIAVPAPIIESLGVHPPAGWFDYPGECVLSTSQNWARIKAAALCKPCSPAKAVPAGKRAMDQLNQRYAKLAMTAREDAQ